MFKTICFFVFNIHFLVGDSLNVIVSYDKSDIINDCYFECDKFPDCVCLFLRLKDQNDEIIKFKTNTQKQKYNIRFIIPFEKLKDLRLDENFKNALKKFILDNYLQLLNNCVEKIEKKDDQYICTISEQNLKNNFNDPNRYKLIKYFSQYGYKWYLDMFSNLYFCTTSNKLYNLTNYKFPLICNWDPSDLEGFKKQTFEEYKNRPSVLYIFINLYLEEKFIVSNYDDLQLNDLISQDELNSFINKYIFELCHNKIANLNINLSNFNLSNLSKVEFSFSKSAGKNVISTIKLLLKTNIKKQKKDIVCR